MNKSKKTNYHKRKEIFNRPVSSNKLIYVVIGALLFFIALLFRIGYYQFVRGPELKELASRQQTTNRILSPNRGIIYDSTGKILAQSASVDTVTINPSKILEKNKEPVAKAFSEIFGLDYDEVYAKVTSTSNIETIVKKIEKDKIDELKKWMEYNEKNNVSLGINIDSDVKRYYPYGTLASNLLGFCNTDNIGQEGIELKWDNVLSGTPGKITTITDAISGLIPDKNETYIAAENGSNITLTIDANIQAITEKYLKQACIENNCRNGGTAIIMNPSTGDILSMASYPTFDSNNPRTIPSGYSEEEWNNLSSTDQVNALTKLWKNKCVSETYEPGSTFKIITAAVGIEENVTSPDIAGDFYCPGYEVISDTTINCWKTSSHGSQTLRQSLMNSCNPSLMQLGRRISAKTLYKYYNAFGLFNKTGVSTSGEVNSYFWDEDSLGAIELATMSFGQRFRITPIQLITAVSSVANNGVLMQPRLVKQVENSDTGAITAIDSVSVREVLSRETCDKVMDMLESVVTDGTGRYGQVQGYSIAGKTGTSEPDSSNPEYGYVASFIGISPVENSEVVILVALYNPSGKEHGGGSLAAPVASQILTEVLPYLGIPSDDLSQTTSNEFQTTTLPDIRNKTVAEAKKILENSGFSPIFTGSDSSVLVTDQVPKPGTFLTKGASVVLYSEGNDTRISVAVPDLKGMSYAQARNALKSKNLNINVTGTGIVISQDQMAGTTVEEGTVINVTLKKEIKDTH